MGKELMVIIAGEAGTGKSTLMLQIEKVLKENGYNVELNFKGNPDYTGENTFHFHNKEGENFDKKSEAIKTNTRIVLREMQLKHDFPNTLKF
jgi:ABC-type lipoprotein export system ATPase subunit